MVIGRRHPHIVAMPFATNNVDCPSASHTVGLQRWETDGGAIREPANCRSELQTPLSQEEAHILQCLGASVLSRWNELPTHIQRELFEHSFDVVAPCQVARFKHRLARFLHEHKDVVWGTK